MIADESKGHANYRGKSARNETNWRLAHPFALVAKGGSCAEEQVSSLRNSVHPLTFAPDLRPFGKLMPGSGLLSAAPPGLFFLRFRAQ
jgi:hypothetical protein